MIKFELNTSKSFVQFGFGMCESCLENNCDDCITFTDGYIFCSCNCEKKLFDEIKLANGFELGKDE